MKFSPTTKYQISGNPDNRRSQNNMSLTFHEDSRGTGTAIGCDYSFHHWHNDVAGIIKSLENMIAALKDFQLHTGEK